MARIIAGLLSFFLALTHYSTVSAIVSCDTCESGHYYDGCNSCACSTDGYVGCTARACMVQEVPYCETVKDPCSYICSSNSNLDLKCGSDGITYDNDCKMKAAVCESSGMIYHDYDGPCALIKEPCNPVCPYNIDPKCGSDGLTYSNGCQLQLAVCKSSGKISEALDGACGRAPTPPPPTPPSTTQSPTVEVGPCHYVRCDSNTVCEVDDWGNARCVGSDLLEPAWCDIECAKDEVCMHMPKACFTVPCPQYECVNANANEVGLVSCDTCESGSYFDGCNSCICSTDGSAGCTKRGCIVDDVPYCEPVTVREPCYPNCPYNYDLKCGSDGFTYDNGCKMQLAVCTSFGKISHVHDGPCATALTPPPTPPQTTQSPTEPCVNIKSDKWCLKKVDKCDRKDKVRNNCQLTCGVCKAPCANIKSDEWCLNKIDKCDNKAYVRDKCQATCGICQI